MKRNISVGQTLIPSKIENGSSSGRLLIRYMATAKKMMRNNADRQPLLYIYFLAPNNFLHSC